jgi:NADPH-dependent 2,4-dienoyl-CoA reductase/sulfur reductase-like enzyme
MAMAEPRIVVVGAGPAGMRACETLVAAGLRPVLIDEARRPGGRIYQQPPVGAERPAGDLYGSEAAKAQRIHALQASLAGALEHRAETLVWNCFGNTLDLLGPDGAARLDFDALILATGATDLALPFPGWTMPGVYALGGAQIALKTQGCGIGRRVAFLGAGPLLPLVAWQYMRAGAEVVAVLDATPFTAKLRAVPRMMFAPTTLAKGVRYVADLKRAGVAMFSAVSRPRAEGDGHVERIVFEAGGVEHAIACDALGASFGLRSETQLADLAGCRFAFDPRTRQYLPERDVAGRTSRADVYVAGDGAGIGGADAAELAGERAALALIEDRGLRFDVNRAAFLDGRLARLDVFRRGLEAAYPFPAHLLEDLDDSVTLCRCEGISVGALRADVRGKDARELNRLKAFSRIGMGRCQGRMCGRAAAELLAVTRDAPLASAGRLRGQPPVKPIPMLPELLG